MIKVKNTDKKGHYQVYEDGRPVRGVHVLQQRIKKRIDGFEVEAYGEGPSRQLAAYSFSELSPIHTLSLRFNFEWFDFINDIYIDQFLEPNPKNYSLAFRFKDPKEWRGDYSYVEYFKELFKVVELMSEGHIQFTPKTLDEVGHTRPIVFFNDCSPDVPLINEVMRCADELRQLHEQAKQSLEAQYKSNSITTSFQFPEEVRTYCEQYLVYFVQFLKDLGVEASHEFKQEAGKVLFSVRPTDPHMALEKIRTALEVYLQLPSSPISQSMGGEIAIQRLESQVFRLHSELKLAAAELQAKNATIRGNEATIEAQQLTINVQKALLNGEILLNEAKDVTPKENKEERVELLKGTVALTAYKDKGVELNWARMWNELKELFLEKDE